MSYFPAKLMQRLLGHKNFYIALAVSWTFLILFLCLISFNNVPDVKISGADKYVHFTFYFGFVSLWSLYFKSRQRFSNAILLKVFCAAVVYGILIEFAQSIFTQTRKGDVLDVLANTVGAATAVFALYIYRNFFKKDSL